MSSVVKAKQQSKISQPSQAPQPVSSQQAPNIANVLPVAAKPQAQSPHPVPPRYHPPPQPTTGILKPPLKSHVPMLYPPPSTSNDKYPPEVPKLAHLYLQKQHSQPELLPLHRPPPGRPPHQIRLPPSAVQHHSPPVQPPPVPSIAPPPTSIHRLTPADELSSRLTANHIAAAQHAHQLQSEMLKFVRKAESDTSTTTSSNSGRLSVEQPTKQYVQTLLSELRMLKEANQRLSDDNQELRDLCCFLDDDRQKGRKLAREWQRFGRYTASVMRQEVSAYQNKLRQLDDKQQEMIRDNLELKELCLYLDEERTNNSSGRGHCQGCGNALGSNVNGGVNGVRDDGDGSSSSTNADETLPQLNGQFNRSLQEVTKGSVLSDQTLQYVRSLENRIRELEEQQGKQADPISGRPEAVVRALQVLEVREQLERREKITSADTIPDLDDKEKALVREMCNVVWRKLEESPEAGINHV